MRKGGGASTGDWARAAVTLNRRTWRERQSGWSCGTRDQLGERHVKPRGDLGELIHVPGDIALEPGGDRRLGKPEDRSEFALGSLAASHARSDLPGHDLGWALICRHAVILEGHRFGWQAYSESFAHGVESRTTGLLAEPI